MANARIAHNNTGHDRTGIKEWKWKQARECLVDPCVRINYLTIDPAGYEKLLHLLTYSLSAPCFCSGSLFLTK